MGHFASLLSGIVQLKQTCGIAQVGAGDKSWGIPAFLRLQLEDGFAVAEFGSHFVIAAKGIPDEKSGDDQEDKS
jgi:hypothetical protein